MQDQLQHYGVKRRSGRYPWGSGEAPYKRDPFLDSVRKLREDGMSEQEIVKALNLRSTADLRARYSVGRNEELAARQAYAVSLKDKGMSYVEISKKMGESPNSVKNLIDPNRKAQGEVLKNTMDLLKNRLNEVDHIDVGPASELYLGISDQKFKTAIEGLRNEGYVIHYVKTEQPNSPGVFTTTKVMSKPGTTFPEVNANRDKIEPIGAFSSNGGKSFEQIKPPVSISSKRVDVRYAEDGGSHKDGVIEIRRGVDDISLGNSRYAQVRIAVDGTHYLKGMAVYSDKLPDGIDVVFNTNKSNTGNKMDAMKSIKDDSDRPFGAVIKRQNYYEVNGKKKQGLMNIVNEEGDWGTWSSTLSSQMLSKQNPSLIKAQLDKALVQKRKEYDEIMALTNPTIKKKLLEAYSDSADADAVHLKAAAMPRQKSQVILPIPSLKDNEVYAPNFNNGETLVLIRHPHGGTFEIPTLKVNNKNPEAKKIIGNGVDAIGINHKVAERLSGADFDGDSVIAIPNNLGHVKSTPALKGLAGFDPKTSYPAYDGMRTIDGGTWSAKDRKVVYEPGISSNGKPKQHEMGNISNLITDMTIKGAHEDEIARAVRHSMVVIDSEKHALNYKLSYERNGIAQLKAKYQGVGERGNLKGASTLISRSASEQRKLAVRKPRISDGEGPLIDPVTGEKRWVLTGEKYTDRNGKLVDKTVKSTKMAEVKNAYELSSGTTREALYAEHANALKAIANKSRLAYINTPNLKYSPAAAKTYAPEVKSIQAKLDTALMNKPLERKAQRIADVIIAAKKSDNPNMSYDELKKVKGQALITARSRVGARKARVELTDKEWEAIQAGAISDTKLKVIIDNSDLDHIKSLATPRQQITLSPSAESRVRAMIGRGATQAEVAQALGVSTSTINNILHGGSNG